MFRSVVRIIGGIAAMATMILGVIEYHSGVEGARDVIIMGMLMSIIANQDGGRRA